MIIASSRRCCLPVAVVMRLFASEMHLLVDHPREQHYCTTLASDLPSDQFEPHDFIREHLAVQVPNWRLKLRG
jgi:hypothetical protein